MERFKTRTGVVLTEIAGEYVLVSAKSLSGICPYVTQINETSAFLWAHLVRGATMDQLISAVTEEYEASDPEEIRSAIADFLSEMKTNGYLLSIEED